MNLSVGQKLNGLAVQDSFKLTTQQAGQSDGWMFTENPATDKRRRVRLRVSPTLAKLWLEKANKCNRPVSDFYVTQYACDMIDGRWQDNGDSLKFNRSGELIDGQHRLNACVESGKPLDVDVVFGLAAAAKGTIDIGRVRTAAHIAGFDGIKNTTNSCALAALLLMHRKHGIHRMNNGSCKPTKTEIVQLVKEDRRIPEVAGQVCKFGSTLSPHRVMSFCYYLFSDQNQSKADTFFAEVFKGIGLSKNSPTFLLRARLIQNAAGKSKLPALELIALFFKAWNVYRANGKMGALRWNTGGPTPESFPEI